MDLRIAPMPLGPELSQGLNSPIFLIETPPKTYTFQWKVITNPRLKDLNFKMSAPVLYQAIETYLGSVLAAPDLATLSVGGDQVLAKAKASTPKALGPPPQDGKN